MTTAKAIVLHWTGGSGAASDIDKRHYHGLVESDAERVEGHNSIGDNFIVTDGRYAAHTRRFNTRVIGLALCGMRGATELPLTFGPSPINKDQFIEACRWMAELCLEHDIDVTPETVLTHAEVQSNLNIPQNGKWDISVLPWRDDIRGARLVGDYLREVVSSFKVAMVQGSDTFEYTKTTRWIEDRNALPVVQPPGPAVSLLRKGSKGAHVRYLQEQLRGLRYHVGRIDGDFGPATDAAVRRFQADHGLTVDGIVGDKTWEAMTAANPAPLRDVSAEELVQTSRIAQGAAKGKGMIGMGGAFTGAAMVSEKVEEAKAVIAQAQDLKGMAMGLLGEYWLLIVVGLVGVYLWRNYDTIFSARMQDEATGKTMSDMR